MRLDPAFYLRNSATTVAKQLLGKILFTKIENKVTAGMIVETEAYSYQEKGCHAYKGMTKRNEAMFAAGGVAYVYLCYGVHEMFNVVTNKKSKADAVLVRALQPMEGMETMMERIKTNSLNRITSGPGKLTKAMSIDRSLNGKDLIGEYIWIEDQNINIHGKDIESSERIGIGYAGDDARLPWRFTVRGNKWVSK